MQTSIPLPSFVTRFVRAGLLVAGLAAGLHLHAQSLSVVPGSKYLGLDSSGKDALASVKVVYKGPKMTTVVRAKINGSGALVDKPVGGTVTLVNNLQLTLVAHRHISGNRPATSAEFNVRGLAPLKLVK